MQIIPITVTNKIASVPCGTFIVADNTDYQLQFAFDEEWTAYDLKTCRFLVKGQYVDVDFTGSTVTIPSMPSDAYRINVGVFAGDLSTTTPAQIMVMSSVLATQGTEYDPAEPSVLPDIDELALDDTFVVTDVSEGEKARANIGQIVDYVQSAATLQPYDGDPEMDGEEASPGTSDEYARGDHVHPADPTILHSGDEAAFIQIYQSTVPFSQGWFCGQTATEVAQIISSQIKYVVEGNSELWDTIYFNPDAVGTEDSFVIFESIIPQNDGEAVRRVTFNGYMIGLMSETSLYSKPANGIPSNDLDEDVNRSLDHADKAVRFEAQTLSKAQQTQARDNIGAASISDLGTVFTIKGEVTNVSDLPATGNTVGDVYYVSSVQAGYIWLETTDHPNGYWEELGEPIDLSAYAPLNSPAFTGTPTAPTAGTSTNNTQIATTAFVKSVLPSVPSAATATPSDLGTAAVGTSTKYAREDHVHDFNSDFVTALLQIAEKVAYVDEHGQDYYDALEAALTHRVLSSISAAFTQGSAVIYDTDSLDSLKQYLVVTAHYSDNTDVVLDDSAYTLSGTLTAGTSTITAAFNGKTDTFDVTVTAMYAFYDYIKYVGTTDYSNDANAVPRLIKTAWYDDLNSIIFDFDVSPTKNLPTNVTSSGILGGHHTSGTGVTSYVAFYGDTNRKRVSVSSKGSSLGINDIPNMAVGSVVHVHLDPHSASPSTLTADALSVSEAWTTDTPISSEIGYFGMANSSGAGTEKATLKNFAAVGTLKIYNLSNVLLAEYKPCIRATDNLIGVYDTVGGVFYTCSTSTYAKVGHSNCVYAVGNWT